MPPRRRWPRPKARPSRWARAPPTCRRQSLAFVEENVAASFDLAQRLVQARTVEEIAALQQEFVRRQMKAMAEQGKTLGEMAGRGGRAMRPKRPRNRER